MFFKLAKKISNSFLNLIYNQKCLVCGCSKTDDLLCKTCSKDVQYLSSFAHRIYSGIPIYCAFNYQGSIKKLIQLFKFSHKKQCAKVLSNLLFSYFQRLNLKDDYIIIYPQAYFLKSASRGYNHMFLIAREFSKLTGFCVEDKLIKKKKYTKPQYSAKNRKKNIKGSFEINDKLTEKLKNKKLLLIDDITTSGATLDEIIGCLKDKGFKDIICLTIAKAGKY